MGVTGAQEADGGLLSAAGDASKTAEPTDGSSDGAAPDAAGLDPPGTVASALQIDPAHDGVIDDPLLVGPLHRLWSVALPERIAYPVIARDLVVVVTYNADDGAHLSAFHGHTGVPAWGPIRLGASGGPAGLAAPTYEAGRIFTTEADGIVRAFDLLTGEQLWQAPWPNDATYYGSAPTAYGGIVYAEGEGTTLTASSLIAFDESTGTPLWQSDVEALGRDPTVTSDRVFVSHVCEDVSRFDRLTRATIWHRLP